MPNKQQRMLNRLTAEWLKREVAKGSECPECGEYTHHGHYVPPSFGEPGFWVCDKFYDSDGCSIAA